MNVQKLRSKLSRPLVWAVLLIVMSALYLLDCIGKESIQVGFVAQLTGVQAELGVQERNGVQLAVEKINAGSGVVGRPIKLVVRDDLGTPEGAQAADRELIDAGVVAIIGHATSGQTIAGLAVTNPARVVMLSPTATTPELSGREDFFFRILFSLADRAHVLAQRIYQGRMIARVAIIYDADNAAYTKAYQEAFAEKYQSLGGVLTEDIGFSSRAQPDFTHMVAQLRASNPEGLLIIAADIDTALIAQRTRLMGWTVPLFTSSWAQTETLVNNGGRAVEGLELEIASTVNSQTKDYLDFKTRYQARFGQAPSFGAVLGYEAAIVLAAALKKTGGKPEGLSHALVSIKNFKGLADTFSFDRYGDVLRPIYLGVIHDGKYVVIRAPEPADPRG
jgi:branched-chain amino acid transport system substrate-binding protein